MKIDKLALVALALTFALVAIAPVALAQSSGTNINDLMGQRPGNAYYQNSGSGSQTQGSGSTTGSAGASVLQQEPTAGLSVDAPAPTASTVQTAKKSSSYKLFAILAVAFLLVAITLFVLGINKQKAALRSAAAEEAVPAKEVIIQAEQSKIKKSPKKKPAPRAKKRKKKR